MFTEPDTWTGGAIELLVALGPSNDERRLKANRAVWRWPVLRGPYLERDAEPSDQSVVSIPAENTYYGTGTLASGSAAVAFATRLVEDSDGLWLYAGTPLGSLAKILPIGAFPFGQSSSEEWVKMMYEWLFGLAQHLFAEVKFERAVIGWLTGMEVEYLADKVVPEKRGHAYIVARHGGLEYYAPNLNGPLLE